MCFDGNVVNADTIVMEVIGGNRILESIQKESENSVPCAVLTDGGEKWRKTVELCNGRLTIEQSMHLVTN